MSERTIDCPRCGRTVNVPTTGEKVWCSGCGQKFRFDAGTTPEQPGAEPPTQVQPAHQAPDWTEEPADTDIDSYCEEATAGDGPAEEQQADGHPREPVHEPTAEEDESPEEPAAKDKETWQPPEPHPVVAQPAELRCVACGRTVLVPTDGTPVNCEGCGQEYRLDLAGSAARPPAQPPPLEPVEEKGAGADTDEVKEIDCPRCSHKVIVPVTGAKVRCPGCRQKFRFDPNTFEQMTGKKAPPPLELEKPAASPEELLALWPSLGVLVARAYEDALVDDVSRVEFRDKAARAAALGLELLPAPVGGPSAGYAFLTSVLPQTTLDEIVRLSIAEYRQLQESLEETQQLLDEQLAQKPDQGLPAILSALPPTPPPGAAKPAPQSNLGFYVGLTAIAVAIVVALFVVPRIVERLRQDQQTKAPRLKDMLDNDSHRPKPPPEKAKDPEPDTVKTDGNVAKKNGETKVPEFDPKKPEPPPTKQEQPHVKPAPRYYSRWKPAPDGWITVFNGTDLDGLLGDPAVWTVKNDRVLEGSMPGGVASIGVDEAAWTHFQIRFEAMLGNQGTFAVRQGKLRVHFTDKEVRAGYGDQPIASVAKGLARRSWYPITIDFHNASLDVRIRGVQALSSAARREERSNPLFEVRNGAVRVRNVALRIHEHDEDYAAVVLGEGYVNKPETPIVVPEAPKAVPGLPLGEHTLFDGESLEGWARTGGWTVMNQTMLARAATGQLAVATAGNLEWRDVVFQAEACLTRKGRMPRQGEYFLIIFRCQDPENFLCIRFALEGIYEIGYYRNGRWAETGRARFGLGSDFNKWHTIQIKVIGKKLDMVIDGNSTGPTLPIAYWGKGLVGVGVTGGEAVFRNVRVRALR